MKKNDLLLLSAVAVYSYLFYNQSAGINYLVFNLFLILALMLKNGVHKNIFNTSWWLTIAGSLISSVCILLYGNTLSVIATIISISLVAAFSVEKNSSLIFASFHSLYSYLSAIVLMFVDWAEKSKKKEAEGKKGGLKLFLYIIPFIISILFFFLYRDANPLFKNFTSSITFDFITWSWVRFVLVGFILLYGYFYHRPIAIIANKDLKASNNLFENNFSKETNTLFGFKIEFSNELLSGIILFSMLNILLFLVNVLDLQYLWLANSLPEGINFSESVHQSIGTLIMSIVFAVLIILIFFRGNINFNTFGKTIKILAYIWILQNAFMIISTAMRNQLYVNEFSLTYKRIGVYVYLILALIGLLTTLIKIASAKSNWYLFRSNSWLFYGILIISCTLNWDRMITQFNLNYSKSLDLNYLVTLSSSNIDLLLNTKDTSSTTNFDSRSLHLKTFNFLKDNQSKEWKSWNIDDQNVFLAILETEKKENIPTLLLSNNNIRTLSPIKEFKNLKKLDLSTNKFRNHYELAYFPKLEELDLSNNTSDTTGAHSFNNLPILEHLTSLTLSNNYFYEFSDLKNFPKLKYLNISNNIQDDLNSLPVLLNLQTLDLSGDVLGNLFLLHQFPSLTTLKINSTNVKYLETLPPLDNLKTLEVNSSKLSCQDEKSIKAIGNLSGLTELQLSSNDIQNIYLVNDEVYNAARKAGKLAGLTSHIPVSLEVLNLYSNKIKFLDGIERIENLKSLVISENELVTISPLQSLTKLEYLDLGVNKIEKISPLQNLKTIKTLLLNNNLISEINALDNLKNIEYLDLSGNNISTIASLETLIHIKHLNLSGNINLTDITVLQNMSEMEDLNLGNCPINDLTPLHNLKKLKTIRLSDLNEASITLLKKQLPNTVIENNSYTESVPVPSNY